MSKRITILGAGESGTGAALLANSKGYDVFVSDFGMIQDQYKQALNDHHIEFEEKQHSEDRILNSEEIIKSPGIPDSVPLIQKIIEKGIPIIDEVELAFRYSKGKIIAITGTNGKTTTTLLIHHILKSAGVKAALVGNIGNSFAKEVFEGNYDCYVLEISSFQLDYIDTFKPDIAVLLNITPDHLDRYDGSIDKYAESKFRILKNSSKSTSFIFFEDNEIIVQKLKEIDPSSKRLSITLDFNEKSGSYVDRSGKLVFNTSEGHKKIDHDALRNKFLKGVHNKINLMAASLAALEYPISWDDVESALESFQNAPHRLEFIAEINGIEYINDSKATNLDSVKYALNSFSKPIIWIAGGTDKGNDYSEIFHLVKENVKAGIFIGADNSKLNEAFGRIISTQEVSDLISAIRKADRLGTKGDLVLLSPACASFDRFKNYEDRGNQFKEAVLKLQKEKLWS